MCYVLLKEKFCSTWSWSSLTIWVYIDFFEADGTNYYTLNALTLASALYK